MMSGLYDPVLEPMASQLSPGRYFSYGASMEPNWYSVFRLSHRILQRLEGHNDGLVSVASSRWGGSNGYKGTLVDVSHLDLINWSNRLKWWMGEITGNKKRLVNVTIQTSPGYLSDNRRIRFNAIAFYLAIAGMSSSSPSYGIC